MMTLITGFTCPPTIYFKFITKCDSYFYYKVRWSVITKCDSFFITKCDKCYYKVRQVLQSVTILLQSATIITKCDSTGGSEEKKRALTVLRVPAGVLQSCSDYKKLVHVAQLYLLCDCDCHCFQIKAWSQFFGALTSPLSMRCMIIALLWLNNTNGTCQNSRENSF